MQIVERIQYPYIAAALQSVKVIDRDDDEELMNPYTCRTTKMRTSQSNEKSAIIDYLLYF